MALKDLISFSSLKKPLDKADQVAQYISGLTQPIQEKIGDVVEGGVDIAGNTIDFAKNIPDKVGDITQQSMREGTETQSPGFIRTAIDYVQTPEGQQLLQDALRLGVAATTSDPNISRSLAQGYDRNVAQRRQDELLRVKQQIQDVKSADKAAKDLNKATIKFDRDLKMKGVEPAKKGQDLSKIPDDLITTDINPVDGKEKIYVDKRKLQERKNSAQKQAKYNQNIITKNNRLLKSNIDKLITKDNKLTKIGSEMKTRTGIKKFIDRNRIDPSFRDMEALIKTLKANLGFQEIQNMRDNSPTGGALGQVTERELDFLQSAVAALDVGMSEEQIIDSLMNIRQSLETINSNLITDPDAILMGDFKNEPMDALERQVEKTATQPTQPTTEDFIYGRQIPQQNNQTQEIVNDYSIVSDDDLLKRRGYK